MFSSQEIANFTRENKYAKSSMSVKDVDFYRILSTWMVFGDTFEKDEDFGRSAPFYFYYHEKGFYTYCPLCLFLMYNPCGDYMDFV